MPTPRFQRQVKSVTAVVLRSLAVAAAVGAASALTIEIALGVLRRLGHVPANLANQPELLITIFVLGGGILGIRLRRRTGRVAVGVVWLTAALSVVAADAGILVGGMTWLTAVTVLTNSEIGLGPLSIVFLWLHGFLPMVVGMSAGFAVQLWWERTASKERV